MSTEFTEELRRSLSDFVRNSSDAEFYQGLRQADYEFFSQVEEPKFSQVRNIDFSVQLGVSDFWELDLTAFAQAFVMQTIPFCDKTDDETVDHENLALAA